MTDPRPRPDAVPTARPAGRLGIGEVVAAHRRIESRSAAGPVVLVADAP